MTYKNRLWVFSIPVGLLFCVATAHAGNEFFTGHGPIFVVTSDFDGNGSLDLAVANGRSNRIGLRPASRRSGADLCGAGGY